MTDAMNFSDEQLDTQQSFDDWEPAPEFAPPPPAGTYHMYLDKIRDMAEKQTKQGLRLFATLDFRIQGGEYDTRAVNFQRVNNVTFNRRDGKATSFMMDLVKSGGIQQAPTSNKAFALALQSIADRGPGTPFQGQLDWEGVCGVCRDKFLMNATQSGTIEEAKQAATKEDWDGARKASVKAKNYRAFPINANGSRKDIFTCPDCGEEVRAQVQIKRFIP
jgi:hypothetical protein